MLEAGYSASDIKKKATAEFAKSLSNSGFLPNRRGILQQRWIIHWEEKSAAEKELAALDKELADAVQQMPLMERVMFAVNALCGLGATLESYGWSENGGAYYRFSSPAHPAHLKNAFAHNPFYGLYETNGVFTPHKGSNFYERKNATYRITGHSGGVLKFIPQVPDDFGLM